MNNIQQYYNKTKSNEPKKNVKYIIEAVKPKPGKAIDLGCGAGNETVYLIKNNWNVTAIDRENVKERIEKRLTEEEQKRFDLKGLRMTTNKISDKMNRNKEIKNHMKNLKLII